MGNVNTNATINPQPVNLKSMCAYLMGILNGLRDGEINPNQGVAIAKVASQINQAYANNIKQTMVEITLERLGHNCEAKLRTLDSKKIEDVDYLPVK